MVVLVLTLAGVHVPVMPLLEVVGSVGGDVVPWQRIGGVLKVGFVGVLTVMVSVALVAHCPDAGVKV